MATGIRDKVAIIGMGCSKFGERWVKVAKRYGLDVDEVTLDWGTALQPETVKEKIATGEMVYDYKSLLQEYTQQNFKTVPRYNLVEEHGPAHDKRFRTALVLDGEVLAEGLGKSKKEAEQKAAKEAFERLSAK